MNECQGTLSESSWVTTMMLDTSRGHPRFHKSGHGGSVDVFLTLPSTKKKKKKKKEEEAIYGHGVNGTFLVEILVTVLSDLILYNKQKFRMCLQLVTRGIINSPPKM